MQNWKKATKNLFVSFFRPKGQWEDWNMKCFCTNCFDVKELVEYIELNGTYGHCLICGSGNVKRISADRIGRVLKAYLDDTYRDRKAAVLVQSREGNMSQEVLSAIAETEGWQSVAEILIEDKEIFSERISPDQRLERLWNLFAATGMEYESYADITERRFVPK